MQPHGPKTGDSLIRNPFQTIVSLDGEGMAHCKRFGRAGVSVSCLVTGVSRQN